MFKVIIRYQGKLKQRTLETMEKAEWLAKSRAKEGATTRIYSGLVGSWKLEKEYRKEDFEDD